MLTALGFGMVATFMFLIMSKLLSPLTVTDEDCAWIEGAFDSVIAASHRVPGAVWSLGKTLMDNAVRKSA